MAKRIIVVLFVIILLSAALHREQIFKSFSEEHARYEATAFTPSEVDKILKSEDRDKYVVIDVRTKVEYDKGHLPGAIHADYHDTEALKKAAGDKIPIAYCAFSAMRGPYAAYQLYKAGYENVAVLDGGISAWAEDIQGMDSADPQVKTVFNHPKDIFPKRKISDYPKNQGEVEIKVIARRFNFEPSSIRVKHGQKVTLHMMSVDVTHGLSIPEYKIEEELLPNEPKTISFIADRKGNFPFVCSVICGTGHDHASMVGNLIVE